MGQEMSSGKGNQTQTSSGLNSLSPLANLDGHSLKMHQWPQKKQIIECKCN